MTEHYQQTLAELANHLVTPERYGRVAILPNLDYQIPANIILGEN